MGMDGGGGVNANSVDSLDKGALVSEVVVGGGELEKNSQGGTMMSQRSRASRGCISPQVWANWIV